MNLYIEFWTGFKAFKMLCVAATGTWKLELATAELAEGSVGDSDPNWQRDCEIWLLATAQRRANSARTAIQSLVVTRKRKSLISTQLCTNK